MCRVLGFVLLLGWGLVSCAPAAKQVHTTPVDMLRDHYRAPRADPRLDREPLRRQRAIDLTDTLRILRNQPYIAPGNFPPDLPITGPCVWQTAGPTNTNGRVTSIAVDESNPQRMFAATVGGVWRSLDGGRRWMRVTDQLQAGVFGAVAITAGNPNEVFIGGGDPNLYYKTLDMRAGGPGLWQSTNGGGPTGWVNLGPADLTNAVIFRIRVDPDPPHNVYVAASSGLWLGRRTTASGPLTWARLGDFDAPCSDVVVDFAPPNDLVYAACYPAPTVENGIWRYDGSAWTKISYGITASQAGFIRLAMARRNYPRPLFAMIEKASNGSLQGVYRTEVGAVPSGVTWTNITDPAMDDSYDYTYFNCLIEVDPENESIVYVGTAKHLFRSENKGSDWPEISDGADYNFPNTRLHDDQHAMALVKATPAATQCDIVIVGNDGGLDRADRSTTPWHWENIGHGINATEYYNLATQPATGSLIAGGTQDNGSPITYGNRSWYGDPTCDGSYVGVEGKNGCTFYQVCYMGTTDVRIQRHVVPGFAGTDMPIRPSTSVPLCPPIATHPTENGKALAGGCPDPGNPTLLSTGGGVAWTPVMDGSNPIAFPSDAEITALGIGWPSAFESYYVGFKRVTSNGTVTASTIWATQNAGVMWQKPSNVAAAAQINAFAVEATNPLRAFAALGGGERVLMTTDGGVSWTGIAGTGAGSLPPVAATGVAIDPWDPDLIYVSTDVGVFRGKPSTMQWWPFDQGLPRGIDVNDITVNKDAGTLMIGTMGYGAYTRDIRPGIDCRIRQASIRDNVFDRGLTPSPSGFPDPEHPIEDMSRAISTSPGGYFYKPDDTAFGRTYWWTSTDIRVDVPTLNKVKNQVAIVDHVALEGCPVEVAEEDRCPTGAIIDRRPRRDEKVRVFVQVTNRGTAPIQNLRVMALWADATTSLPLLPMDFWSTYFPVSGNCSAVTTGPWLSVDPASPCKELTIVRPEYPEVVEFAWVVPDNAPAHSCILALVETADDPIDPTVRSSNERQPWVLVPENRQIALRNLHVEDAIPTAAANTVNGLDSLRLWNPTPDPRPFSLEISRASMRATGRLGLMLPQDSDSLRSLGITSTAAALTAAQLAAVRNLGVDTTKVHWVTSPEATFDGLEVAPGQSKKLAVIYDSGAGPPTGTTRFVIAARRDRIIFGGSTYLMRTPVKP